MRIKKFKSLTEATIGEKAAGEGDVIPFSKSKSGITGILDDCLQQALVARKTGKKIWVNPLFVGPAGSGKTSIVEQWAKNRGINTITRIVSQLDAGDVGGAIGADLERKRAVRLGTEEFEELNRVPSILFLDEINMAKPEVVSQLYTIVNEHRDPGDQSGRSTLKNLLFTVAAMNPGEKEMMAYINMLPEDQKARYLSLDFSDIYSGAKPLNLALATRFDVYYIEPSKGEVLDYLMATFDDEIEKLKAASYDDDFDDSEEQQKLKQFAVSVKDDSLRALEGRKELAKTILKHPNFEFDDYADAAESQMSGNQRTTMPRTLEMALNASNGTKDSFLNAARRILNNTRYDDLVAILSNYKDKQDKANSVFSRGTDSKVIDAGRIGDRLKDLFD